jgi:5-formyltetrahydrofolate cyclo-ligase
MKSHFKKDILEKRDSLTKDDILSLSRKIQHNLEKLEQYKKAKTVMHFVSFGSEVFTHDMIKSAIAAKTVAVPKIVNHRVEPGIIIDFDSMVPASPFGILEPMDLVKIAPKNIEIIMVPGIVFDMKGHRLGYGLGFYDDFLEGLHKNLKVGLCFDFQVAEEVPREEHDIPVDIIVTDKRVIDCRKSSG